MSDDKPTCEICQKSFERGENLAYHMRSYHAKIQEQRNSKYDESKVTERSFKKITTNQYLSVKKSVLRKKPPKCNCAPNNKCGDDCINRLMKYECEFHCHENCENRAIQTQKRSQTIEVFITENKGWGVKAKTDIKSGSYFIQYVGEVLSEADFIHRLKTTYLDDDHYYGMYLESGYVLDARNMGIESRFINSSCCPNCAVEKWTVKGLPCLAIFASRDIMAGEEITFYYNFQSYNEHESKICNCNSNNCRGFLGKKVYISIDFSHWHDLNFV